MKITLYDTLSRSQRTLKPADAKTFRFYCCGPTVYGPAHIGNFRTFILQDVLRRVLEVSGMRTYHVRNITDVDDKTIRQSQAEGMSLEAFTTKWTERFRQDCARLNLLVPHVEPTATGHIPEQIQMIEQLMNKQHAYPTPDGSVYYRLNSFASYGKLTHLVKEELTTHQGVSTADEYTRDTASDFALWKAHKPEDGPNAWESPWSKGRPGWHIECSAMALRYLGPTFDLHGGGVDLCFPHHENEIAQSEAATGCVLAHHWFHIAHLLVNSQKMSKSLGNLYTLSDLEERGFSPLAVRYVLLSGHYRQPLNFTLESLHAASKAIERIQKITPEPMDLSLCPDFGPLQSAWDALVHDLNTPTCLGELFKALPILGSAHTQALHHLLYALGLNVPREAKAVTIPEHIQALANERLTAKAAKDFAKSDTLRKAIEAAGWKVLDHKDGTSELRQ